MPPAPELPHVRRRALVVATGTYDDPALRRLRAPAQDAAALADVLADVKIGAFAVTRVEDRPVQEIRVAIAQFLATSELREVALVYLSCHGLLDASGELYFAATDTHKDQLTSTGLEAGWLRARLQECRATQQLVLLDCCFSGAFVKYSKGAGGVAVADPVEVPVEGLHGGGRGHVVLTASRAAEYSFEGKPRDETEVVGSIFTTALVQGLRTGAADYDNDGLVSADEAFHYVKQYVLTVGAKQTPQRSIIRSEGNIMLGYSPVGVRPAPQPTPLVPEQARESLVEVAEMVAAVPDRPTGGSRSVAIDPIPEGPAGELAMLRAIHRVLDDPEALTEVVRTRSLPEVVKLVAAVRVTGLGDRAADPLRAAALVRPVEDVLALVAAVRTAAHPTDAEVLLATAASTRPAADVARLCGALAGSEPADDLAQVLRWAARMRPLDQVGELVVELERVDPTLAGELLGEVGEARPVTDVAEMIVGSRQQDRVDDVTALLDGVRRRPMSDAAHLVVALRAAGDNDAVDKILLWVQELPTQQIAALVAGLRREGAADEADVVVRWMGWQLNAETLAGLVGALDKAELPNDAGMLVGAVASGTVEAIAKFAVALGGFSLDTYRDEALDRGTNRQVSDTVRLMALLEPRGGLSHQDALRGARLATADALAGIVARRPSEEVLRVLAAADAESRSRLLGQIGTAPTPGAIELLCAIDDTGETQDVAAIVAGAVRRSPDALAELFVALAAIERPALVDQVATAAGRTFLGTDLPKLLHSLERVHLTDSAAALLRAVPAAQWAKLDVETIAGRLLENKSLVYELDRRHRRKRRNRSILTVVAYAAAGVGLLVLAAAIFVGGAALSRTLVEPHFNWGDWAAFVPTTLVVGFILGGITAAVFVVLSDNYHDIEAGIVGWLMVLALIAGFSCGFFVDDVREFGVEIRNWLAWNV